METPLDKALVGNQKNLPKHLRDAIEAAPETPVKMISTGMPGVDPMTGTLQQNQLTPSPINPTALGSFQNQIPNMVGQPVTGTFDRVLPAGMMNTAQEAVASKTNDAMRKALGY
tara:strand:+ start:58 stop:399 length:342 start_codon:yes stop_codon:yes gene_type:complete